MSPRVLIASVAALVALALAPAAALASPPTATLAAPEDVETTKAKLKGSVDPADHETYYCFEVTSEYEAITEAPVWPGFCFESSVSAGAGSTPLSKELTALKANTKYSARLTARNFNDPDVYSEEKTFTTDPAPIAPTATVSPATDVSYVTATIAGQVNPEGGNEESGGSYVPIHWAFELESPTEPGVFEPRASGDLTGSDAESSTAVNVGPAELSGLTAGHTYHYRLAVTYAGQEVPQASESEGEFTTLPVAPPAASIEPVSNVTATGAHFSGTVEVTGADPAFTASCHFEYVSQGNWEAAGETFEFANQVSCEPSEVLGSESQPVAVAADPHLSPNTTYHLRLVASNAGGAGADVAPTTFSTPAIKPTIEPEALFDPTPTAITLRAKVNANNADLSDCHFAYGSGGALDQSAPCVLGGNAGAGFRIVSAAISGLTPSTEYGYRLLATNLAGTTEGGLRSFTSLEEPEPEECPNQALREQQRSTFLPDCRAYEMVSPLKKGNGDIVGDGETNVASAAGDAVTLSTRTPFGDTEGSGVSGQTQYVSRRGAEGWATHAITPQPRPETYQTFFGATLFRNFSEDLRSAVVYGYDFPGATGDLPLSLNIYTEDTATRALQPVTALQGGLPNPLPQGSGEEWTFPGTGDPWSWGVSADARHVAFVSNAQFLPEAAPGVNNLYTSDDGTLHLAGILPDGSVPSTGSSFSIESAVGANTRWAMSADGSRQLFIASQGGPDQLYQRIDNQRTAWVSEPERPNEPSPPAPTEVHPVAATPDGRNVFFTTSSPLLEGEDSAGGGLYRWTDGPNPESESNLTLITHNVRAFMGVSNNGQRVYYRTGGTQVFVWDHGATHLVGSRITNPVAFGAQLGLTNSPGYARTTPDGRYLAFLTQGAPTGYASEEHPELYLYDLADETLHCASCPSGPPQSENEEDPMIKPAATTGVPSYEMPGLRPRFLADDGRVFFSTVEPLLPEDTNGAIDTYQYDPATGALSLLSTGTGNTAATFTAASASGDDVFIVTRKSLLPSDTDDFVDLYDVRAGGGLPEPLAPPSAGCLEEGCQGSAASPPSITAPASHAEGRGNATAQPPHCSKGSRQVRRHGKLRCLRPHRHRHHRAAGANRRAAK